MPDMPQGAVLILRENVHTPGAWEDDNFAFDFKLFPDIAAGQSIASIVGIDQDAAPSWATALNIGVRQPASISGTQVIVSITLPNGAAPGYTYQLSCTVVTSGGETLVQSGQLLAQAGR